MRVKVQSVRRVTGEPLSFSCLDEETGRAFSCTPSKRFMQAHPSFDVEAGDHLMLADFIPDFITKDIGPLHLVPENIEKLVAGEAAGL